MKEKKEERKLEARDVKTVHSPQGFIGFEQRKLPEAWHRSEPEAGRMSLLLLQGLL